MVEEYPNISKALQKRRLKQAMFKDRAPLLSWMQTPPLLNFPTLVLTIHVPLNKIPVPDGRIDAHNPHQVI